MTDCCVEFTIITGLAFFDRKLCLPIHSTIGFLCSLHILLLYILLACNTQIRSVGSAKLFPLELSQSISLHSTEIMDFYVQCLVRSYC